MPTTTSKPVLARVEINWSENSAIGSNQVFRSLDAADAYVAAALKVEHPPSAGYNKTDFQVVWSDGHRFRGRADISARDLGRPVLRETLIRTCRKVVAWYGEGQMGVTSDRASVARETSVCSPGVAPVQRYENSFQEYCVLAGSSVARCHGPSSTFTSTERSGVPSFSTNP